MLSIKQKNKTSKTVKNTKTPITRKKILTMIVSSLLVLFFAVSSLVLYYSKDIIIYSIAKQKDNPENKILKIAEDAFKNGYLENSAIQFQNYLSTNPSTLNKLIVYKKLFEIHVLSKQIDEAFIDLKEIELLDTRDNSVFINRIKLLLRINQLKGAKFEIDRIYSKFKKSPEFLELYAIYFIKMGDYQKALNELIKIPYRKRGYANNIKISLCYIKLNQISRAISYLNKMEPVVRTFENKSQKGEFLLIRSLANILKGELDSVQDDLRPGILNGELRNISYRLMIFNFIMQDNLTELNDYLANPEISIVLDDKIYSVLGNYYFYKKDYIRASEFYEKIVELRTFNKNEMLALVDIYYYNHDYDKAEKILKKLNAEYNYKNPSYFKNMAKLRLDQGDFPLAYSFLKQGVQEYKDDTDFYLRLALINYDEALYENAEEFINEGIRVSKILNIENNKKFDILRLLISGNKKKNLTELELLDMRNHSYSDLQSYFRLIEFYLLNNRLFDTKREIDTVENIPQSEDQIRIFNVYKLIYAINSGEYEDYFSIRKLILDDEKADPIYRMVCLFLDGEYDECASLIVTGEKENYQNDIKKLKILYYIKSLVYFFKKDYPSANMSLSQLFELDPYNRKALYLKGLMNNKIN